MSACKSCGARIIWCETEQGKRMPVDELPTTVGNVCVYESGGHGYMCRALTKDEISTWTVEDGALYTSHFATCPNAGRVPAAQWRAADHVEGKAVSELDDIVKRIEEMDPPAALRLAADLLDESARAGGNTRVTRIAHAIADRVTRELGAALILAKGKR